MRPADDVYMEVKKLAKDAMLAAIEKERNGDQIDRSLLKNVLGIFIEVGMGGMDCYDEDFEQHLLAETASYYRKKATVWITVRGGPSPAHALAPHPWPSARLMMVHVLPAGTAGCYRKRLGSVWSAMRS